MFKLAKKVMILVNVTQNGFLLPLILINFTSSTINAIFPKFSYSFSYFESENEYENFGKIAFIVEEVKLIKIKGNKNPFWVTFTKIITFLANLNITFCELFWVYWFGGFDEIRFVIKPKK